MIIDHDQRRISFRQSWLDTAQRCPEEGRLAIVRPDLATCTDEAIIGTGAHWAIEQVILGRWEASDIEGAVTYFFQYENDEDYRFTKRGSVEEVIDYSQRCARSWVDDLMGQFDLDEALTEVKFSVPLFEYRDWDIFIEGTVDFAPKANVLGDWKTAASDYKQKDKQMWAIQPTIYALAAVNGGIRDDVDYQWPIEFDYGVMIKRAKKCRGQKLTVQRTEAHAEFAMERMRTWVDMFLDKGLERPWPLIDDGNYLCSARWCDFYSICRGAHIEQSHDLFGWNPR